MMKTILVTGGTGFIGSHTSLALIEKGYKLLLLDSLENSSIKVIDRITNLSKIEKNKISSYLNFLKGDIRDEDFLNDIFEIYKKNNNKIDAVIHFAGLKSVDESTKNPIKYWDINVSGTIKLIKVMEKFECFNLVFSSSATIYGVKNNNNLIKESDSISPINTYGRTKEAVELILRDLSKVLDSSWRIAVLRYFNPIGAHPSGLIGENPLNEPNNILPIINRVAAGKIKELKIFGNDWETTDGTGVRDYIHVMDLAEGHISALEYLLKNNNSYLELNLGTGKGTSVLELVNCFSMANKVKVPFKYSNRREGDSPYSVADNTLAKLKLNWEPKRDLYKMCKDSWKWFTKNPEGFK
mgnify:CR=1 FL=1